MYTPPSEDLFSMALSGTPSEALVRNVAAVARLLSPQDTRTGVLVRAPGGATLKVAAAEGFQSDFVAHAQEIPVDPGYPSCGRCAATGVEVFVEDVRRDPQWQPHLAFAERYEIRACWSFPILAGTHVLGTVAIYHRQPRLPTGLEVQAIRYLTAIAAVALARQPGTPSSNDGTVAVSA